MRGALHSLKAGQFDLDRYGSAPLRRMLSRTAASSRGCARGSGRTRPCAAPRRSRRRRRRPGPRRRRPTARSRCRDREQPVAALVRGEEHRVRECEEVVEGLEAAPRCLVVVVARASRRVNSSSRAITSRSDRATGQRARWWRERLAPQHAVDVDAAQPEDVAHARSAGLGRGVAGTPDRSRTGRRARVDNADLRESVASRLARVLLKN